MRKGELVYASSYTKGEVDKLNKAGLTLSQIQKLIRYRSSLGLEIRERTLHKERIGFIKWLIERRRLRETI